MVDAAWGRFAAGDAGAALGWLERARGCPARAVPTTTPTASSRPIALAAARSIIAPLPPAQMAADAAVRPRPRRPAAKVIRCRAWRWGPRPSWSVTTWRPRGGFAKVPTRRCRGRWWWRTASPTSRSSISATTAGRRPRPLARRARTLVGAAATVAATALVLAVNVLVDTRAGRAGGAEADRRLCRQHLDDLLGMAPWLNAPGPPRARPARRHSVATATRPPTLVDRAAAILAGVDGAVGVAAQLSALSPRRRRRDAGPAVGPAVADDGRAAGAAAVDDAPHDPRDRRPPLRVPRTP